jgi:hypothetical protein
MQGSEYVPLFFCSSIAVERYSSQILMNYEYSIEIFEKSNSRFKQFCESPKTGLQIYRVPTKILAFLQADYFIS